MDSLSDITNLKHQKIHYEHIFIKIYHTNKTCKMIHNHCMRVCERSFYFNPYSAEFLKIYQLL